MRATPSEAAAAGRISWHFTIILAYGLLFLESPLSIGRATTLEWQHTAFAKA